jgi:hypothetical protein
VPVCIFGGGFAVGRTSVPTCSGEVLAKKAVVLVNAYHVGPLGFLAHPELSAESLQDASGNYGLLDMIAALQWIKKNIAAFGGASNKATIFGESAGGIAVSQLCAATGRDKRGVAVKTSSVPPAPGASPKEAMREKPRTKAGRTVYKMRKAIVDPVFGQIKEQRGFRHFSLRGRQNVSREWRRACAVRNLLKLFWASWVLKWHHTAQKGARFTQNDITAVR